MRYTANSKHSGTITLPPTMEANDELLFNVTGRATNGKIIYFRFPMSGSYRVDLIGANGSEGNHGITSPPENANYRPPPNAVGGKGRKIRGTLTVSASESMILVVGQAGSILHPALEVRDGSAGGSGGGTFLFRQSPLGDYTIAGSKYTLLALAASGGGANDYGYQGTVTGGGRTNGGDASTTISTSTAVSPGVQTYCTNNFVGTSYSRSGSIGTGGFGGGGSSDDARPNGVGWSASATSSSYFLAGSGQSQQGLNDAPELEGNGEALFTLLAIVERGISISDSGMAIDTDYVVKTAAWSVSLKQLGGH